MNIIFKAQKQTEGMKRKIVSKFLIKHGVVLVMLLSLIGLIINEESDGNIYTSVLFLVILAIGFLIKFCQNFDPFEKMESYWRKK